MFDSIRLGFKQIVMAIKREVELFLEFHKNKPRRRRF